jgi:hypothetical protein
MASTPFAGAARRLKDGRFSLGAVSNAELELARGNPNLIWGCAMWARHHASYTSAANWLPRTMKQYFHAGMSFIAIGPPQKQSSGSPMYCAPARSAGRIFGF